MKMRKILSAVLLVVMLVGSISLLSGCGGSDSEFVGTWKATGVMVEDKVVSFKDYGQDLDFSFDIKKNGKITATTNGVGDGEGKWEEKDGKITITDDVGTNISGKIKDGKLILDYSGMEIVLEKE